MLMMQQGKHYNKKKGKQKPVFIPRAPKFAEKRKII